MGTFDSVEAVKPYKIWDGAVARAVHGREITMAIIDVDAGVEVPTHHHVNEQLGFVLRGAIVMRIDGDERELQVGEMYVIHADVPHSARGGPDGATVVDVFSPPRADWDRLERLEPAAGHWP